MKFPGMATISHTNILRRSEIQMLFSNNINRIRPEIIDFCYV